MLFRLLFCMILAAVIQHVLKTATIKFLGNRFMRDVDSLTTIYSEIYPVIRTGFIEGKTIGAKCEYKDWIIEFGDALDGIIGFEILVYEALKSYYKILNIVYVEEEKIAGSKIYICREQLENMCEELKKLVDYTNKS